MVEPCNPPLAYPPLMAHIRHSCYILIGFFVIIIYLLCMKALAKINKTGKINGLLNRNTNHSNNYHKFT